MIKLEPPAPISRLEWLAHSALILSAIVALIVYAAISPAQAGAASGSDWASEHSPVTCAGQEVRHAP